MPRDAEGKKWACDACIRGHRVSNCNHSDRPLKHVHDKGRPVSQCQHCRANRRSRASHVKCDCGKAPPKCKHLQPPKEGHKETCCCNHGGRCTCCSLKTEHPQLDTVLESDPDKDLSSRSKCSKSSKSSKATSRTRRRTNTTSSENIMTFESNDHHHNPLSRANSLRQGSRSPAHSSVSGGMAPSQSEAASPLMIGSSSFAHPNRQLPPLDLSGTRYSTFVENSADFFSNVDCDLPIFSAGLDNNIDWSGYDGLNFASTTADFAPSSYSQPQSYGQGFGFAGSEQLPSLTTTTSTSGDEFDFAGSEQLPTLTTNTSTSGDDDFPTNNFLDVFDSTMGIIGGADLYGIKSESELYKTKTTNNFVPTPNDESGLLTGATAGFPGFSLEESSASYLLDYHGLPTYSPDEINPPLFWDGQ